MTPNPFDNQQFREEMTQMFKDQLAPIVKIQGEHELKLDEHQRYIDRSKGGIWVMGGLLTLLEAALHFPWWRKN